jgi:hypothetical protein
MQARRAAHARTVTALEDTISARTHSGDFRASGSFAYNTNIDTTRYALIEPLELQSSEPVNTHH